MVATGPSAGAGEVVEEPGVVVAAEFEDPRELAGEREFSLDFAEVEAAALA